MATAVIVLKAGTNKASVEDIAWQSSQLTMFCYQHRVEPIDCVVCYRGCEDIIKKLRSVDRKKRFDYIVIYSPHQIAKSKEEYMAFVNACRNIFKSDVKFLRV